MEISLSNSSHSQSSNVALVVGVTGMVGSSLVDALKKPVAAGSPWAVYGLARRSPSAQFPLHKLDRFVQVDILDRAATFEALSQLAGHVTHLFWVTLAELHTDEATCAANSAMLSNVLDALTCDRSGSRLRHIALQTGIKHYYLGLLGDPALINLYVPFREDLPRCSCSPKFLQCSRIVGECDLDRETVSVKSCSRLRTFVFVIASKAAADLYVENSCYEV